MIQLDDMDRIFREAAGEYKPAPGDMAWRRLRRLLLWRKFRVAIGGGSLLAVVFWLLFFIVPVDEGVPHATSARQQAVSANVPAVVPKQSAQGCAAEKGGVESMVSAHTLGRSSQVAGPYQGRIAIDETSGKGVPEASLMAVRQVGVVSPMKGRSGTLLMPASHYQLVKHDVGRLMIHSENEADTTPWRWSVEACSGFTFSQFSGFSGGLPGQKSLRDDGSWLLSPEVGAGFRVSKKGWYAALGLRWNRIGQKVRFDVKTADMNPLLSYYEYDTTWVWIYDPPYYGEPFVASVDSTFVVVYQHQLFAGTLSVDYATFPFLFGYEYRKGGLALSVAVGLSFSIPVAWHGRAPNGTLKRLLDASDELSHQIDVSMQLNLEASARIATQYWLFFRPEVGFGLTGHDGRQSLLAYRNNKVGFDVGLRVDLNRR